MRINFDVYCASADIRIDDVDCVFDSASQFIDETGFDFPEAKKVFFEPQRNIFVVERSGSICEVGSDLPEMIWLTNNIEVIKQAGVRVNKSKEIVVTWQMSRLEKFYFTDWLVTRHLEQQHIGVVTTLTDAQYTQLLTYRQALRDMTEENNVFPTPPAFVTLG